MRTRDRRAVALTLLLVATAAGDAHAGTPSAHRSVRIGTVAAVPARARIVSAVPARRTLQLTVQMRSRDARGLAAFARAVATPGSAQYGHYLSVAAFAQRFGARPAALRRTAAALRSEGLRVGPPTANRLTLPVSGAAGRIDRAFATRVETVRLAGGVSGFTNRSAPAVPGQVARYVQGVFGLSDLDVAGREAVSDPPSPARAGSRVQLHPRIVTGGPQPCATAVNTGADTFAGSTGNLAYRAGYTADELASVYDFSSLYTAGDTGAGQTVALVEEEPYQASDIQTFQQCYGTSTSITNVDVGGGVGTTLHSDDESALDIEAVIGLAPRASVLVYQGTSQLAIMSQIESEDRAKLISTSWAACESSASAALAASYTTVFQEAAAQGQSVFASSGDSGSSCGSGLGTQLPASDPGVTSVGGTTLYATGASGAEPFSSGRTAQQSVWNNQIVSGKPTGTGGGLSVYSAMPSYQSSAPAALGVLGADAGGTCGATRCRQVPDVSADGDGGSGYVTYSRGAWKVIGGTSFAAPLWASFAALSDASPVCRGLSLGALNPALYGLAGGSTGASLFTDIVNASPRTGAANNDAAGTNGGRYGLRAGYDMDTGLGSMHGGALATALCRLRAPAYTVALTSPGAQATTVGTPVALQIAGADSGGLPLSYSAAGLPPGLAISAGGAIAGVPTTPGVYSVTVAAGDSATNSGSTAFTWTVNQRPVITSTVPPAKPKPPSISTRGRVRLTRARHGRYLLALGITLGCVKSGPRCTFSLLVTTSARRRVHARTRTVPYVVLRSHPSLAAGGRTNLSFTLSTAILKLLVAHRKLAFAVTLSGTAGRSSTTSARKTFTIKAPTPPSRARRR